MSAPDFIQLATELLTDAIQVTHSLTEAHVGLLDSGDNGALDAAFDDLTDGNLSLALAHLNTAVALAAVPPLAPTAGRNQAGRHQSAIQERHRLHTTAQIARVLVLQAILTTP